ncbi:MAG: hypothetical protein RL398_2017 [Planctomycetota bacterium]|jgi:hypothetical protein
MNIFVHFLGRRRSRRVTDFAHRVLQRALARVGAPIREIRLRIRDENAARGGIDHRCSLELRLQQGGMLHLHELAAEPESGVYRLAQRAGRLLRRETRKRREDRR